MLRIYSDDDFHYLQEWVTDASILFRFSGPDWQFPLTREVLNAYIAAHPQRQFYMGISATGVPFAFGEIIGGDAFSPRLGRLLIGEEAQRGKGLGQLFVKALIAECIERIHPPEIYLYVFEDNTVGINCYKKCGFEFCDDGHLILDRDNIQVKVLKMAFRVNE
jgi:RimJ/RimL family protein N-acetyltransferase